MSKEQTSSKRKDKKTCEKEESEREEWEDNQKMIKKEKKIKALEGCQTSAKDELIEGYKLRVF